MNFKNLIFSLNATAIAFSFCISCKELKSPATPDPEDTAEAIYLTDTKAVNIALGTKAAITFYVTPSSMAFNPEDISLSYKGPEIKLCGIEQAEDEDGTPIEGTYNAIIQDNRFSNQYYLKTAIALKRNNSGREDEILKTSEKEVISKSLKGVNTGLPYVIINTPGNRSITSKTEWIEGAEITILNPDQTVDYKGKMSIKGRGNSTWGYPKKPYAIKLDEKAEVLGMKKHKRWCLLANYMDRTLIRNAVSFEISRRTSLAWTPSGKFVEVILNDKHIGNYYLCEQIKSDKDRVALKDGYIFECDSWFDEVYKFRSPVYNVPWQFKDPDEVTPDEVSTIRSIVTEFENTLNDSKKFAAREYLNYIDPESFVDWWIVNELAQNSEVNHPKSTYVHMEKGGKFVAGPVWDFDWGTYMVRADYGYSSRDRTYYIYWLSQDPEFKKLIKQRWAALKGPLASIPEYIDLVASDLTFSDEINIKMWPINRTTNQDESLSYTEAINKMKTGYRGKYQWLDSKIASY